MSFFRDSFTSKITTAAKGVFVFIFGGGESEESRWLRILILVGALTVGLLVVAGLSAFFLTLQGEEQTMVPNIREMDIVEAIIDLQEKNLVPHLQVRYSSDPSMKGKVIDQRPAAGSSVKAGKRVTLIVSQGSIVNTVENFVGRNLNDVRTHLQTLFATYEPLLRIQEPVTYVFNKAPAQTILEQKPEGGAPLTGLTDLVLIVSRGPETPSVKLASYLGITFQQAVTLLARNNVPFVFSVSERSPGQTPGFVVSQTPAPGTDVGPDTRLELHIAAPEKTSGKLVFGMFQCSLPAYPVWIDMKLEAQSPAGERRVIFTMKHPGGLVSVPYSEEAGSTLILSVFNKEVYRDTVIAN
ncbi:MAG: PASTA domain-containing protein [Spirochaetales bacterium]|nr:PASTA domain-containing protein [Spirochaetales bacterium]